MTPTQTFENYPEFANAGQKSQPNDAKYAAGFIPSDVLPAEWMNWFLNGATKGVTALNTGVKSIEQEINAVLESRSVTPDIDTAGQLLVVLNKIKAEAVLAAHPVGSLYWTSKNENPAVTFGGGTWKQITDKFVLAAGSTYKAEATGGASAVTLSVSNMPSHSHNFTPSGTITMDAHSHGLNDHTHGFSGTTGGMSANATGFLRILDFAGNDIGLFGVNNGVTTGGNISSQYNQHCSRSGASESNFKNPGQITINVQHTHSFSGTTDSNNENTTLTTSTGTFKGTAGTTGSTGEGESFPILPPYIVKYCWERTA